MLLCFQTLNYPSSVNCCVSKHQGKKNPSLLPSIVRKGEKNDDQTKKLKNSHSLSDKSFIKLPLAARSNTIGIIGGVSVDSTLSFAKSLMSFDNEENGAPPFVLCSDPSLSRELLSAKNVRFDHDSIVEKIRRKRTSLEKSGACCLVMPCDLLHCWYDEIERGCSVPVLHAGECVAKELKDAKLRPMEAGSPARIGVLAINENLVARFYREKLEYEGFEVILPDKDTVEHIVIPAVEAIHKRDFEGAQNLFRIALQVLLVRAVNRIIIASDDLRQLLPPHDPLWRKCIDPMDALARSSIEYARSVGRGK